MEADHLVDPWDGDEATAADAIDAVLGGVAAVDAVGHRVVHGGSDLVAATPITAEIVERISALTPLAPLHQPRALAGIGAAPRGSRASRRSRASTPPSTPPCPRPPAPTRCPAAWRERWELRRFGFHGLSHAWAARRAVAAARATGHTAGS